MTDGVVAPVTDDELDTLFACLLSLKGGNTARIGLAVSGGADSMALMHLASRWQRLGAQPVELSVVTVDHGLRPQAAFEIAGVAAAAQALDLHHQVLRWEGTKPRTGVQAAARLARLRLLRDHAREARLHAIATAHSMDDQAETVLMRLARGSGVDGLAAMASDHEIDGLRLLRPLLAVPRARLVAGLREAGITWFEDPTNRDLHHERPRLRAQAATLSKLGLNAEALARSASRLRRAREALEIWTARVLSDPTVVAADQLGFVAIDWLALRLEPPEIRLRVLARVLAAVGGGGEVASLGRLEAWLAGEPPGALTVARCRVLQPDAGRLVVLRESGRRGLPRLSLAAGETGVWDDRFEVTATGEGGEVGAGGLVIMAPTSEAIRDFGSARGKTLWRSLDRVGRLAAVTAPAVYRHGELIALLLLPHDEETARCVKVRWLGFTARGGPSCDD